MSKEAIIIIIIIIIIRVYVQRYNECGT